MKKILLYVLAALFVYTSPMADCTVVVGQAVVVGGAVTKWIGFPNSSGTPSSPTGSWAGYGYAGDRCYWLIRTASENGTAQAINIRFSAASSAVGENAWVCLWNGTTLVGGAAIGANYANDDWTGELTLTVADGQSLDFSTSDTLRIGIAFDALSAPGSNGLSVDGGSDDSIYYDNSTAITTAPPTTISESGPSGTAFGLAVILRYVTR